MVIREKPPSKRPRIGSNSPAAVTSGLSDLQEIYHSRWEPRQCHCWGVSNCTALRRTVAVPVMPLIITILYFGTSYELNKKKKQQQNSAVSEIKTVILLQILYYSSVSTYAITILFQ